MKFLLLTTIAMAALIGPAQALVIVTGTETLPSASLILAPTPNAGASGFGTATADHFTASTQDGRSPFDGVSGYEGSTYAYVVGGGSATFSDVSNPAFVTGGDTFSFILGSPDDYNSLKFSNGDVVSGSQLISAFTLLGGTAGSGYYVATISGLGSYNSVTFSSQQNSLEFATYNVSSVPLPASFPLFGGALLGMSAIAFAAKRARKGAEAA